MVGEAIRVAGWIESAPRIDSIKVRGDCAPVPLEGTKHVYALRDPRTEEIRYVGVTSRDIRIRFSNHIYDAKTGSKSHVRNWILSILSLGMVPICEVIESNVENWREREISLISSLPNLTNITAGGDGRLHVSHSAETREKIRQSKLGKTKFQPKWSEEAKRAMSEKRKGWKISSATLEGYRRWRLGRPLSTEHKANISAGLLAYNASKRSENNVRK